MRLISLSKDIRGSAQCLGTGEGKGQKELDLHAEGKGVRVNGSRKPLLELLATRNQVVEDVQEVILHGGIAGHPRP